MYKQYKDPNGELNTHNIIRTSDGVCIPFNEQNSDYQAYLKWLEEGNTPLAADAATEPADEPNANQGGL